MKKSKWYLVGVAALALVFGLMMAACEQPTDDDESGGKDFTTGTVTTLTANTWAIGELTPGGANWYKFTATAETQYIHVASGTLDLLYGQLHDSAGNEMGSKHYYVRGGYQSLMVISGSVYYIKVWPTYGSGSGTYKIAFNTSVETPDTAAAMASATTLSANTWANGELTPSGARWYKFTATAETQYIHVARGTISGLYVQLRDSVGNKMGSVYTYDSWHNTPNSLMVISGNVYYIEVSPSSSSYSGTYKIAFNTSTTAPD